MHIGELIFLKKSQACAWLRAMGIAQVIIRYASDRTILGTNDREVAQAAVKPAHWTFAVVLIFDRVRVLCKH